MVAAMMRYLSQTSDLVTAQLGVCARSKSHAMALYLRLDDTTVIGDMLWKLSACEMM